MRKSMMHLVQTPIAATVPRELTKAHLDILRYLRDQGAENAWLWEEKDVDFLFKLRPRFVALVRGHENAVIEITREGLLALRKYEESSNGHRKAK